MIIETSGSRPHAPGYKNTTTRLMKSSNFPSLPSSLLLIFSVLVDDALALPYNTHSRARLDVDAFGGSVCRADDARSVLRCQFKPPTCT